MYRKVRHYCMAVNVLITITYALNKSMESILIAHRNHNIIIIVSFVT